MSPVRVESHTADLKIHITAKSREDLFRDALRGMTDATGPVWKDAPNVVREFTVHSADRNSLLVDVLSEAVFLGDIHNEAYDDIHIEELTDTLFRGRLRGKPIERLSLEIKAVTHHGLNITESGGMWEATLVFDI